MINNEDKKKQEESRQRSRLFYEKTSTIKLLAAPCRDAETQPRRVGIRVSLRLIAIITGGEKQPADTDGMEWGISTTSFT